MCIDWTPGVAMMIKAALASFVKIIAVALNSAHKEVLADLTTACVGEQPIGGVPVFAPADKDAQLDALKPARLKKWETQQKRPATTMGESPSKKRAASVCARIEGIASLGQTPSPMKPFTSPPAEKRSRHSTALPSTAPSSSSNPAEADNTEQSEDLTKLMNHWG